MGATREDKEKQIETVAALPVARSKAQAMRRGKYAESTVRHATTRTMQRISKSGFCETLRVHGVDEDKVARKIKELLDGGDPKAALGVIRLWLELHDLVNRDRTQVVNVVVVAMRTVVEQCVEPGRRAEAMRLFGDSLARQ
jgi:hypothetical protein